MIEQIKEKNRIRLVTASFRSKFLRQPNHEELTYWLTQYQSKSPFSTFLIHLETASNNGLAKRNTLKINKIEPLMLGCWAGFLHKKITQSIQNKSTSGGY